MDLLFFHGFVFLLWTSAVRHSELRQVIRLWWRCSQAGWHLLSVTHRDSEGSKQITFSHLRQHVKLHLIVRWRRLIHDKLQEERFVTDRWNIYRITESAVERCIHWDRLPLKHRWINFLWNNFLQGQTPANMTASSIAFSIWVQVQANKFTSICQKADTVSNLNVQF